MLGVGDVIQFLLKATAKSFSRSSAVLTRELRELCPIDSCSMENKACRIQMVKMKYPYTENGSVRVWEPKFSMPQVNILQVSLKENVFGGALVLTELFGLGLAKCLFDLEISCGIISKKTKTNFPGICSLL